MKHLLIAPLAIGGVHLVSGLPLVDIVKIAIEGIIGLVALLQQRKMYINNKKSKSNGQEPK